MQQTCGVSGGDGKPDVGGEVVPKCNSDDGSQESEHDENCGAMTHIARNSLKQSAECVNWAGHLSAT